jgi:hypothetical protein
VEELNGSCVASIDSFTKDSSGFSILDSTTSIDNRGGVHGPKGMPPRARAPGHALGPKKGGGGTGGHL